MPSPMLSNYRHKKSLGQHFLTSQHVVGQIVEHAGFQGSDQILEIGPGKGALTLSLARAAGHVVAVEKDARLVTFLEEKLARSGIGNVTVVNADILGFDFREALGSQTCTLQVAGNLPYNISSPILEKLIQNRDMIGRAVLMFQHEVGRRLAAGPGTKRYGALSVIVQYCARTTKVLKVSKEAFSPRPKVDSMVVELDFQRPHSTRAADEQFFKRVVKGAFSHRRKTLANSLKAAFHTHSRSAILQALNQCGIDPGRRAETLEIDDFIRLSAALSGMKLTKA